MTAISGVLETVLYVPNLNAAEIFYGSIIGLEKEVRVGNRHVFFRCGDSMLLIFNPEETVKPPTDLKMPVPPHGGHGEGHVCFRVPGDKLDAIKDMLEDNDVYIEADFLWPNGARSIYIRDPAGNSVEFAEPRLWNFEK